MLKSIVNSPVKTGDQTIFNGNLVIGTAGKGIDFSADGQAAGAQSELLDDYEEGTWTPSLTSSGFVGATYSNQIGRYTKIGDTVHLFCKITLNSLAGGGGNYLRVLGIPFNISSSNYSTAAVFSSNLTGGVSGNQVILFANASQNNLNFYEVSANGSVSGTGLNGSRLTATSEFNFHVSYKV